MNEAFKNFQNPPQNVDINSMLSEPELKKLTELLSQNSVLLNNSQKGKNKMTPQEKNKLLGQLSTHQKIAENYKPIKEMTDIEKEKYRSLLLEKMHQKKNMFKQNRTNHKILQKQYDEQLKKMTKEENKKEENISNILQMAKPVEYNKPESNEEHKKNEENEEDKEDKIKEDILDDYIE
jgi:hypothetical protein